jgi:hypothetical protein
MKQQKFYGQLLEKKLYNKRKGEKNEVAAAPFVDHTLAAAPPSRAALHRHERQPRRGCAPSPTAGVPAAGPPRPPSLREIHASSCGAWACSAETSLPEARESESSKEKREEEEREWRKGKEKAGAARGWKDIIPGVGPTT